MSMKNPEPTMVIRVFSADAARLENFREHRRDATADLFRNMLKKAETSG